ncbi:hypothetical protein [Treponema phagedenis]|uniref:hypothetical protein n=1 Tax=Treponema phagedenis TaxID=162 RepID=UPI001583EABA|nr:hypothetical protein [Treponema phagedenis]QKS92728.1 hypothetical protein HPJ96_09345 [Treponema phagedenis]
MVEKIIIGVAVLAIILLFVRKYYRIFTGKASACSCGEKNDMKNGCGCCCSACHDTKEKREEEG